MTNIRITNLAKQKIQPLINSRPFKNSLDRFTKVAKAYTETSNQIPGIQLFHPLARRNKRLLRSIQKVEDAYIYRDRDIRYIFSIEKDENNNDTAILLDIMQRKEVEDIAGIDNPANSRQIKK
ncbi:hypothetical protein ABEI56_24670 [Peribacillus castrilensis]|uniref:hypothetical protein n=1 Tax=Peribacillus TaxID=2675229 RepID=UPI0038724D26